MYKMFDNELKVESITRTTKISDKGEEVTHRLVLEDEALGIKVTINRKADEFVDFNIGAVFSVVVGTKQTTLDVKPEKKK